jgi:hypothetical protein
MSLDAARHDRLATYVALFGSLEELEWSGEAVGPGSGPMFSGNDGARYPACPLCGGLKEPNNSFIESAVGHQPGCRLAAVLGKPVRPLNLGEQAEIAL